MDDSFSWSAAPGIGAPTGREGRRHGWRRQRRTPAWKPDAWMLRAGRRVPRLSERKIIFQKLPCCGTRRAQDIAPGIGASLQRYLPEGRGFFHNFGDNAVVFQQKVGIVFQNIKGIGTGADKLLQVAQGVCQSQNKVT